MCQFIFVLFKNSLTLASDTSGAETRERQEASKVPSVVNVSEETLGDSSPETSGDNARGDPSMSC